MNIIAVMKKVKQARLTIVSSAALWSEPIAVRENILGFGFKLNNSVFFFNVKSLGRTSHIALNLIIPFCLIVISIMVKRLRHYDKP